MGFHKTKCPRCDGDRRLAGESNCTACNGKGHIAAWEGIDRKVSYMASCQHGVPFDHETEYCSECLEKAMREG